MNNQETKKNTPKTGGYQTGLDEWNNRLDQNLETEETGNIAADERAKAYSEKKAAAINQIINNNYYINSQALL